MPVALVCIPGVHLLKETDFQVVAREFPVCIRVWNIEIIELWQSAVTTVICLRLGSDCCTASLLDCSGSAEQSVGLDVGALAEDLCARMILPCIPARDTWMLPRRELNPQRRQVWDKQFLTLDLFLVLETHLKLELQHFASLQIVRVEILDALVVCLVSFKSYLGLGFIQLLAYNKRNMPANNLFGFPSIK